MERDDLTLKAVFLDVYGTLRLCRDPYQHIHRHLGLGEKTQQFAGMFRRGDIDSDEWIRRDAALWQGLSRNYLLGLLREIPYMPGAAELIRFLKSKQVLTAAISTGLQMHADIVQSELQLDYAIANELVFDGKIATGEVRIRVREAGKARIVADIMDREGLSLNECMAVGDGESDIGMFQACRIGVAICPVSERVSQAASITIEEPSLGNLMSAVYRLVPEWLSGPDL